MAATPAASHQAARTDERVASPALLKGLIFDGAGNRMSPSHAVKGGVRYRYYVSQAVLQGRAQEAGSIARLPALRRGAGDTLNQTGQQVVRRNLNIQPTLTIRPGFPVRVIVNRGLVLAPYQS
jgi:type IV secretory pathway VirB10-like protein